MTANLFRVLFIVVMIAVIVTVDLLFLRRHFTARLIVNIGIVVVFVIIYFISFKKSYAKRGSAKPRFDHRDADAIVQQFLDEKPSAIDRRSTSRCYSVRCCGLGCGFPHGRWSKRHHQIMDESQNWSW